MTLLERIDFAIGFLDDHETGCKCDPGVGSAPCELCGEIQLLVDVRRELQSLHRRIEHSVDLIELAKIMNVGPVGLDVIHNRLRTVLQESKGR